MGNRLGVRNDGEIQLDKELGARRGSRSVSWKGVFRRKPTATFLDYDGTSFDNYLQQKSSTLVSQTRSLRNSLEGFPLRRNRSASTGDQERLYPLSRRKESQTFLTSSEDVSDHIYSNLVPESSYESLHPTSDLAATLPTTTRRLLFSTERQVSHNEEEALELAPEDICVPKDTFDDTEEEESPHDRDGQVFDAEVERVTATGSRPHVTFERTIGGKEGALSSKCSASSGARRVGRGEEAVYKQPGDHLGDHPGDHLVYKQPGDHLGSPPHRHHPSMSSTVPSGAHLPFNIQ